MLKTINKIKNKIKYFLNSTDVNVGKVEMLSGGGEWTHSVNFYMVIYRVVRKILLIIQLTITFCHDS